MANKHSVSISELLSALSEDISAEELLTAKVLAEISTQISSERIERNMNQADFADLLGTTQTVVSKWESSDRNFTVKKLCEIACKLNCDLSVRFEKLTQAIEPVSNIIDFSKYVVAKDSTSRWTHYSHLDDELKEM